MLYHFDGLDGYNTTTDLGIAGYNVISGADTNISYSKSGGRFNGGVIRFGGNILGQQGQFRYTMDAAQPKMIVGGSYKFDVVGTNRDLFRLLNAALATEVEIRVNALEGISAYRGANLLGSSANNIIAQGVWYRIEVSVIMDTNGSNGSIVVRVNGNNVLSLTGIDTTNTAITGYSAVLWRQEEWRSTVFWLDDITIVDGRSIAGNDTTDFLGDVRISQLIPTADAGHNDGTPSVAGPRFKMVNDSPGYDTGNYVDIVNTAGNQETYEIQDTGATSTTILGVRVTAVVTKTDASGANAALIVDSGGNVAEGAIIAPPSGSNQIFGSVLQRQPVTNAPWTKALVDALKIGYRVK